jgi:hypothetical protein
LEFRREFDCLSAIAGLASNDDVILVFKDAPETSSHQGVVIDQQHGDFIRHRN